MTFKTAREEDVKVFLNPEEFATSVSYKGNTINVNIQEEMDSETGEVYNIGLISITDAPTLAVDDFFTLGTTKYNIVSIFPKIPTDVFHTVRLNDEVL